MKKYNFVIFRKSNLAYLWHESFQYLYFSAFKISFQKIFDRDQCHF